ncbi:hypothetical protein ZWY2020_001676 [Hordeum vulgare]|nr:hypothetical protein ZWY2020_001676 [Hordeum vulgare]
MPVQIREVHPIVLELLGQRAAIERSVDELRAGVTELRQSIHAPRTTSTPGPDTWLTKEKETAPLIRLADLPSLLPTVADASLPRLGEQLQARGDCGHWPIGHGVATDLQGKSLGEIHTPRLPPTTGMADFPPHADSSSRGQGYHRFPPPPQFDFPMFDGTNPKA